MHGRCTINTGQRAKIIGRRARTADGKVRAHRRHSFHPQTQKMPVLVQRQFDLADIVSAMGVGHETFRPIGPPFDGSSREARGPKHQQQFIIGAAPHAEAAADIAGNHPHRRFRDIEHLARDLVAQRVRILQAGVKRVPVAPRIIIPQAATRFHRHCRYAVVY